MNEINPIVANYSKSTYGKIFALSDAEQIVISKMLLPSGAPDRILSFSDPIVSANTLFVFLELSHSSFTPTTSIDCAINHRLMTSDLLHKAFKRNPMEYFLTSKYLDAPLCQTVIDALVDGEDRSLITILSNPRCPTKILVEYAKSNNPLYRHMALANPGCPLPAKYPLRVDSDADEVKAIFSNPKCPSKWMYEYFPYPQGNICYIIAANPNCPQTILTRLCHDLYYAGALRYVLGNPSCPEQELRNAYATNSPHLLTIVKNPGCPLDLIFDFLLNPNRSESAKIRNRTLTRLMIAQRQISSKLLVLAMQTGDAECQGYALLHPTAPTYLHQLLTIKT